MFMSSSQGLERWEHTILVLLPEYIKWSLFRYVFHVISTVRAYVGMLHAYNLTCVWTLWKRIMFPLLHVWDSDRYSNFLVVNFLQVRDVRLIMDRNTRRSKGVGWVLYTSVIQILLSCCNLEMHKALCVQYLWLVCLAWHCQEISFHLSRIRPPKRAV